MKKTFVILIVVALLGILAASLAPGEKSKTTTATKTTSATSAQAATPQTATTTTQTATKTSSYNDGTYTGTTASNRFDQIQVSVTISNGKITSVDTPTLYGDTGHSDEINSYAIPQLKDQTLAAQSSQIDGVSGASYTTDAYTRSLQAALDQAKA